MVTFRIVRYTGATNRVTVKGRFYLSIPYFLDTHKSMIFGEYVTGKAPKISKMDICIEDNRDLEEVGEYETEYTIRTVLNRVELV